LATGLLSRLLIEGRTVDLSSRLDVETTLNKREGWQQRSREVSGEINGSTNVGECWKGDTGKGRVVGNLGLTGNSLEERHGNVGESGVVDECESSSSWSFLATNRCQVWCSQAVEVVSIESERSVDKGQRWDADRGCVSERSIGGPDKVGEADFQFLSVGVNG